MQTNVQIQLVDTQSHGYRPDRCKGLTINTDVGDREKCGLGQDRELFSMDSKEIWTNARTQVS